MSVSTTLYVAHSAEHNGNTAYLQFVESRISGVNLYLYVDHGQLVSDLENEREKILQ